MKASEQHNCATDVGRAEGQNKLSMARPRRQKRLRIFEAIPSCRRRATGNCRPLSVLGRYRSRSFDHTVVPWNTYGWLRSLILSGEQGRSSRRRSRSSWSAPLGAFASLARSHTCLKLFDCDGCWIDARIAWVMHTTLPMRTLGTKIALSVRGTASYLRYSL